MKCPQCGTALEQSARFCGVCGHRLIGEAPWGLPRPAPAVPADPMIGASLNNRFTVEEKLGEGGFGAVYRGVQAATGRKVAIKLLHPEMTRDENVLARFRREGQVLCQLRDAHTITTYDFDQTSDGTLFIAMELLEGKSLHDLFHAEAPLEWKRVLKIMSQMCTSLEEAHALGIVHRDLKPENIHLENRAGNPEFVKILDFGIAKVMRGDGIAGDMSPQLTATGQTLGTLEYMSPEQLMGKPLDGRSDIYGLGVVAYEMITGQLPFPDAVGPAALISAQLKKTPPAPSVTNPKGEIPDVVDQLVFRMLEKDRNNRFRDATELRREIDGILNSLESSRPYPIAVPTPAPGQLGAVSSAAPQSVSNGYGSAPVHIPTPAPATVPVAGSGLVPGPGQGIAAPRGPAPATPPPGAPMGPGYYYGTPPPGQVPPQQRPQQPMMAPLSAGMGPSSTESIIAAATRSSRKWLWFALVALVVAGGAVAGILIATR
jgi:serine/threonine-protein kinase